ncbi:MAG: hypothetical protein M1826_001969 [Phylliscum demangeonii]|nr:MAG: hypothetical protein M1826_001969 [Phylliscum demangeonii]
MAYNSGYNPDALPAHAEPDQAAAMLSAHQAATNSNHRPAAPPSAQPAYYKPQPAPPRPTPPPQRYSGGSAPALASAGRAYSLTSPSVAAAANNYRYAMSPPPPSHQPHQRPPSSHSRPPPSPVAGARSSSDAALFALFRTVDQDGSGRLSERELGSALVNGDYTTFDPHTVRMMIRMFDADRSGTIGFDEFCNLWGFLSAWRTLFERFDEDRSGNISFDEFSRALVAFGYRLSPHFVQMLFRTYDKRGANSMSFDVFVQSCISLKRMTDVFKRFDDDRDGYITLSL